MLSLVPLAHGQFNYTTNQGVVTITGYTGTNGFVDIPGTLVGLSVTSIGDNAFSRKTITNVTVPDSVTNIGVMAFYSCKAMTNIALGTNVVRIGSSAFQQCSALSAVTIQPSVTNLGSSVFAGCSNLTSVNLGEGIASIGSSAFADCANLTNITIPYGVRSIGSQAFTRCSNLLGVLVSDTVTNIGPFAFWSCVNLRSVVLGTNLSVIGTYAFQSCLSLTNVILPEHLTSVGDSSFSLCQGLVALIIGTKTANIGNYAFQDCVRLREISIPRSVTNIGTFAFANCINLTNITVDPDNPAYFSFNGALLNRSQTTLIQYSAASSAQTFAVPYSVTDIADGAFQGNTALIAITMPDGVTRLPNNLFNGCSNLTAVNIPSAVTNIGSGAFLGCARLTNIIIPDSVTTVGASAFQGCVGLSHVTIGNRVTNLQASAFSGCASLTNVEMGYIVNTIGNEAFRDCNSLTAIRFYGDAPNNVSANAFTNVPATAYYLPGAVLWGTNLAGLPTIVWIPFTCATNNGEITITGCPDRFLSAITISNTITGLPVVDIQEAFSACYRLVSVTFGDSITHLGSHAFAGCTNMVDIYFEGNAPSTDLPVFAVASNATVYYRPAKSGWTSAFEGLKTALWRKFNRWVRDGTIEIGIYDDDVFDVVVPRTIRGLPVTGIGLQAFRWSGITSITLPDSLIYVGNGAFDDCEQLASVTLPKNLTQISWWMFSSCGRLTNITIPASVNTLVNFAFYGSGLRSIYFEGNAPAIVTGGSSPVYVFLGTSVTVYYLPGTTGWTNFLAQVGVSGQVWDAQIQEAEGPPRTGSHQFGFNIAGSTNVTCVVQACADLFNPVWTPLQTNTLTGAPLHFDDLDSTHYPARFYRLHWP